MDTEELASSESGMKHLRVHLQKLEKMYADRELTSADYLKFEQESPKLMKAVRTIEDSIGPTTTVKEVMVLIDRLEKNWNSIFDRRVSAKNGQLKPAIKNMADEVTKSS